MTRIAVVGAGLVGARHVALVAQHATLAAVVDPALATEALARATSIPVIASGGVSRLADLTALRDTGVIAGAISGRALYDGALDLKEALAALA